MDVRIRPGKLHGKINAVASKSYAHRVLIASALCDSPTKVHIRNISQDIEATLRAITDLGAEVEVLDNCYTVKPIQKQLEPIIRCGESGTTARLILPIAAAIYNRAVVSGSGTLLSRPFKSLCDTMSANGCVFDRVALPISFRGKIRPGVYEISGSESSQYISALMYALPLLDGESEIRLTSTVQSEGYIDMTREVLREFGINGGFKTQGGERYVSPGEISVQGDWSNAAFFLCAGVEVMGLKEDSLQRDKAFLSVRNKQEIDVGNIPDLVPVLAVNAATKNKMLRLYNAGRLKLKESDRLESVSAMINSLGGRANADDDELTIYANGSLTGGIVDSFNDHRIVMSAAIASCFCEKDVIIRNAEAVEKSYPTFFDDFRKLGGDFDVI